MVYKLVSNNKQQDTQRRALTRQNKESALVINSALLLFLFAFKEEKNPDTVYRDKRGLSLSLTKVGTTTSKQSELIYKVTICWIKREPFKKRFPC